MSTAMESASLTKRSRPTLQIRSIMFATVLTSIVVPLALSANSKHGYKGAQFQNSRHRPLDKIETCKVRVLVFLGGDKLGDLQPAIKALQSISTRQAFRIMQPYTDGVSPVEKDCSVRWTAYYLMAGAGIQEPKSFLLRILKEEPSSFVKVRIYLALWKLYGVSLPHKLAKDLANGEIFYFLPPPPPKAANPPGMH